jgi:hypothetical protein
MRTGKVKDDGDKFRILHYCNLKRGVLKLY